MDVKVGELGSLQIELWHLPYGNGSEAGERQFLAGEPTLHQGDGRRRRRRVLARRDLAGRGRSRCRLGLNINFTQCYFTHLAKNGAHGFAGLLGNLNRIYFRVDSRATEHVGVVFSRRGRRGSRERLNALGLTTPHSVVNTKKIVSGFNMIGRRP